MESFYSPQPKPLPHICKKKTNKREADSDKRSVYAEVDRRDGKRCRCCRRKGNPESMTALGKIHRAHIVDASRCGLIEASNLCSLCSICHGLEHAKQLWFIGTDANSRIEFEIHEAAVVAVFGSRELPGHVRIVMGLPVKVTP